MIGVASETNWLCNFFLNSKVTPMIDHNCLERSLLWDWVKQKILQSFNQKSWLPVSIVSVRWAVILTRTSIWSAEITSVIYPSHSRSIRTKHGDHKKSAAVTFIMFSDYCNWISASGRFKLGGRWSGGRIWSYLLGHRDKWRFRRVVLSTRYLL